MNLLSPLPSDIRAVLRDARRDIVVTGLSSARVERCTMPNGLVLFLKAAPAGGAYPLEDEIGRLEWMASNGLPVPRIIAQAVEDDVLYLVTEGLSGSDASVRHGDDYHRAIVVAVAAALRRLHATPVEECPFRHPAASRVAEARDRVRAGVVDPEEFDRIRGGKSPPELLDELVAGHEQLVARRAAGLAAPEEAVFTHGDYCLPNVILQHDPDEAARRDAIGRGKWSAPALTLSGFVDCGRAGVADPYQDLALAARSIAGNLGSQWPAAFFEAYGLRSVDQERVGFYTLLDEFF